MTRRHHDEKPGAALERLVHEIRDEEIPSATIDAAARRVWAVVSGNASEEGREPDQEKEIRGCTGIRSLMPRYRRGELSAARTLLVENHARECLTCRRLLREARDGAAGRPSVAPDARETRGRAMRWALAASFLVAALLGGIALREFVLPVPEMARSTVEELQGGLFVLSDGASRATSPGEMIPAGQVLRTAKGSGSVIRLADGSRVEMKERSELSFTAVRAGTTVHLSRGSIIVEAAEQRSRQLYVATSDCRISVTGTIFSVNRGTMGSRVSVVEGEVHVRHGGQEELLRPGDQIATNPSLRPVPVRDEIAWSKDAERYGKLLGELDLLKQDLEEALSRPELRHDRRLLDLTPPEAVVYAAFPNLGEALGEAHRVLRERIAGSPLLREWWAEAMAPDGVDAKLDEAIDRLRAFGEALGPEITLSIEIDDGGKFAGLLLLAEVTEPRGLLVLLEQELNHVQTDGPLIRIVDDPLREVPGTGEPQADLLLWPTEDLLAASTSPRQLRQLAERASGAGDRSFTTSALHSRLTEAYREGTEWIAGVDLERILARVAAEPGQQPELEPLRRAGFLDARHLILEGKDRGGEPLRRAVVSFRQARRGVASWLAPPAPMGSLEFISPDATLAVAFVTKDPVAMVRDLFDLLEAAEPSFTRRLDEFEARHGMSLLEDVAAPLGGEFAFALDGPVLPNPSWKLVLEVYDPERMQRTLEWAVGELNRHEEEHGPLRLTTERVGNRSDYVVQLPGGAPEVRYTIIDGYLLAGPSRAVIDAAALQRESGVGLPDSAIFDSLLPADGRSNFSAVTYRNLGPLLEPLASRLAASSQDPQRSVAMAFLAENLAPALSYAYGEEDRIEVAFGESLGGFIGLGGVLDLYRVAGEVPAGPSAAESAEVP